MISKEIVAIQSKVEDEGKCKMVVANWSAGLVTKLQEVTHGQWLYKNIHVHDIFTEEKPRMRKEETRCELEYQIALGGDELEDKEQYLHEIILDDLDASTGEDQIYWLLALRTAQCAWQIQREREIRAATIGSN